MESELTHYVPVRCVTCKKVLGNKQIPYEQLLSQGVTPEGAYIRLGIDRACCRYNLSNPEVLPLGLKFETTPRPGGNIIEGLRQELQQLQIQEEPVRALRAPLTTMRPGVREFKRLPGSYPPQLQQLTAPQPFQAPLQLPQAPLQLPQAPLQLPTVPVQLPINPVQLPAVPVQLPVYIPIPRKRK